MTAQSITPELRQWIVEQAAAGRSSESVLQAMVESGWDEDTALEALAETLTDALQADRPGTPARAPRSAPHADARRRRARGRRALTLGLPRVVVFGGLLAQTSAPG